MTRVKKEDLINHINDLDCQIDYLSHAVKLKIANQDEEFRLNTLIVKRAHFKKEVEYFRDKKNVSSLVNKLRMFSHKEKKICDYFHPKPNN